MSSTKLLIMHGRWLTREDIDRKLMATIDPLPWHKRLKLARLIAMFLSNEGK